MLTKTEELFELCQSTTDLDKNKLGELVRQVENDGNFRWDLVYTAAIATDRSTRLFDVVELAYRNMNPHQREDTEEFFFAYKFGNGKQQQEARKYYLTAKCKASEGCKELKTILADIAYQIKREEKVKSFWNLFKKSGKADDFLKLLISRTEDIPTSLDHPNGIQMPFQPYDRFIDYCSFTPPARLAGFHKEIMKKI